MHARLPAALLPPPAVPPPLPFTPRRSGRIAKFQGAGVPGTLSWAQRSVICQLGLAPRPEDIDDAALERYKALFATELAKHRLDGLCELFSREAPRFGDVAAHSAPLGTAC